MCIGPLKNLCHWGPLMALSIIKIVSFTTVHCNSQWWPPQNSFMGTLNASLFIVLCACTIYNFLSSIYIGPGFLPPGWEPADVQNSQFLQRCAVCKGYKAPRSHHCKKCGRCVMKMDHHCPWINSCVGHLNHSNFTLFLFFAVCGCFHASIILGCSIYRAVYPFFNSQYREEPVVFFGSFYIFVLSVFALGLSIGVVCAVGMLLYFQIRAIIRNTTVIEDWIISKAKYRRDLAESQGLNVEPFVFPYNLGKWQNIKQVLNSSMTPVGDGMTWEIAPGCDQWTLTREQQAQKLEKKQRSRPFTVIKRYSGYKLPVVHGLRVCFSPPCTDETRIPLEKGEIVQVTRYAKHWLFGEKRIRLESGEEASGERGWFPRCCVIPVLGEEDFQRRISDNRADKKND